MRVTHSITMSCPLTVAWSYLEDPQKVKLWMSGLLESERITPGELRAGSAFRMKIQEGSRVSTYDGEVLELVRPAHLRMSLRGGSFGEMPMIVDYRLSPCERGVRLEFEQSVRLSGAYRMMTPLFNFFGRLQIRRFLQTMKALAEADPG